MGGLIEFILTKEANSSCFVQIGFYLATQLTSERMYPIVFAVSALGRARLNDRTPEPSRDNSCPRLLAFWPIPPIIIFDAPARAE